MLGDFNLPTLNRSAEDIFLNYIIRNYIKLFSAFACVGLTKIIKDGTFFPSGNVVDLALYLYWRELDLLEYSLQSRVVTFVRTS